MSRPIVCGLLVLLLGPFAFAEGRSAAETARIDLPASAEDRLSVVVSIDGVERTLELERTSVRGRNFELLVQGADGRLEPAEVPPTATYRGRVLDESDATVSAVVAHDGLRATVWRNGDPLWRIEPALGRGRSEHLVIPGGVARAAVPSLVEDGPEKVERGTDGAAPSPRGGGLSCGVDEAELGLDLASDYYAAVGSTEEVMAKVEESVNAVNAIYVRDALVEHRLGRVIIRTSPASDPYAGLTTSNALLSAVRSEWSTNQSDSEHDLAAVISTAINYAGIAYLNAVCEDWRYSANGATDEHTFDLVLRHEVGHNWGSNHFEGGSPEGPTIMSGNSISRISGPELDAMLEFREEVACLDPIGPYPTPVDPYAKLDQALAEAGATILLDVLANDHDANCETIAIDGFDETSTLGGTISLSAGTGPGGRDQLAYTAPAVAGEDSFHYRTIDSSGATGEGLVRISVCQAGTEACPTVTCSQTPRTGCFESVAGVGIFDLRRGLSPDQNRLTWKWQRGAATTQEDFGDPFATTPYSLCFYGDAGLIGGALMPAGGVCNGRPCWRSIGNGVNYRDANFTPHGISQLVLRSGTTGRSRVLVAGRGENLPLPPMPLALPVQVQLQSADRCWSATYAIASRNDGMRFRARAE